jgi:NAD(P)-dependent dehydrogenase (short-subunit alcohol dehydrogenase family)
MDSCVYDTLCAHDRWGRIINTGSMHALVASPYKSAYNAAKHGIAGELPVLPRIA